MASSSLWQRFQQYFLYYGDLAFSIDISRMRFPDDFFEKMQPLTEKAFAAMRELESGAIANPDEKRMVGHYWLRNPALAPTAEIRTEIEETIKRVKRFAADALGSSRDLMDIYFFDNTDPDGFDRVFDKIDPSAVRRDGIAAANNNLSQTLVIVVSKSGGTRETRNGMLEAEAKFATKGLQFGNHAVAVTEIGSDLDKYAEKNKWLARFPMYDWIGGRTSVMSAVGLIPMA